MKASRNWKASAATLGISLLILLLHANASQSATTQPYDASAIGQQIAKLRADNDALPAGDPRPEEFAEKILDLKQQLLKATNFSAKPSTQSTDAVAAKTTDSPVELIRAVTTAPSFPERVRPKPDEVTPEEIAYKRKLIQDAKVAHVTIEHQVIAPGGEGRRGNVRGALHKSYTQNSKSDLHQYTQNSESLSDEAVTNLISTDGLITPEMVAAQREKKRTENAAYKTARVASIEADIAVQRQSCDDDIKTYTKNYTRGAGMTPTEYARAERQNLQETIKNLLSEKAKLNKADTSPQSDGVIAAEIIANWNEIENQAQNEQLAQRQRDEFLAQLHAKYPNWDGTSWKVCPDCGGSGKLSGPALRQWQSAEMAAAIGTGSSSKVEIPRCPTCGGTGEIPDDPTDQGR